VDAPLLSIGEFAERVGLSSSALRFYDDCELLKPAAVDRATGYRQYSEVQLADAVIIRDCRRIGMPLALVRDVIAKPDESLEIVAAFWSRATAEAEEKAVLVHELTEQLNRRQSRVDSWWLKASDFKRAVEQVVAAASTAEDAPEILRSVLVECGSEVRLVATDRYRLAIRDIVPTRSDGDSEAVAIVRAGALVDAAHGMATSEEVQLQVADGALRLTSGGSTEELPATHDGYPPYRRLLLDTDSASALIDAGELIAVLEALEEESAVVMEFADSELQVGPPEAAASASVSGQLKGERLRIGFNPKFLLDSLRATDGPEALIEAGGAEAPVLIRSATDGSFTSRIMPIKLR
jgi:DNA-binding transcriptional MerR regulator